ncbi:MAG: aspartate/glutamate racemase family protein [Gemmobacter sp.]|nr:aspartate/glutamate racemase family protein [Gemmobacter sp.]
MDGSAGALRRLLIVNPNTNPAVTQLARQAAQRVLGPHTLAKVVQSAAGPLSIETFAHRQVAEPMTIEALSGHPGYDAYVVACFDDIALRAARGFLNAPVVGAAEAAIAVARLHASRFAIVTTVETMVPGIRALIAGLGATEICTVRATGVGVAAAAQVSDEVESRIAHAIISARDIDGAGAIILGSGGLSGRAADLSRSFGLPVIDSIEAAIAMAEVAARLSRPSRSPGASDHTPGQ